MVTAGLRWWGPGGPGGGRLLVKFGVLVPINLTTDDHVTNLTLDSSVPEAAEPTDLPFLAACDDDNKTLHPEGPRDAEEPPPRDQGPLPIRRGISPHRS